VPERTPEHVAAVLDALAESGALKPFGLARIPADESDPDFAGQADEQGGG
jgi:hypothetical protein